MGLTALKENLTALGKEEESASEHHSKVLKIRNIFQSISFPVKKISTTTQQEHTESVNIYFQGFGSNAIYQKATALWLKTNSNT